MQESGHSEMPSWLELISLDFEAVKVAAATAFKKKYLNISSLVSCSDMALSLHEQFQKQKLANAIESASDMTELKSVASLLLDLYFRQKSATVDIVEGKI